MNIDSVQLHDLCVFLVEQRILIISDLHLGYEESLHQSGFLVPHKQFKKTEKRIMQTLSKTKAQTVVFNGDFKHNFGTIQPSEWREGIQLLETIKKKVPNVFIIEGNHDPTIGPLIKKADIACGTQLLADDVLITHGDEIPKETTLKEIKTIIIGHEHPALVIQEGRHKESYKCFLVGKWKNKRLIVMPSYNLITEGTNILSATNMSPFLQQSLKTFRVIVVGEKLLDFGLQKDLK